MVAQQLADGDGHLDGAFALEDVGRTADQILWVGEKFGCSEMVNTLSMIPQVNFAAFVLIQQVANGGFRVYWVRSMCII